MFSDHTNGRGRSTWAGRSERLEIEEFPLLLSSDDVRALIDVARQQGTSAVGLARQLVIDYLRQTCGAARATIHLAERTEP